MTYSFCTNEIYNLITIVSSVVTLLVAVAILFGCYYLNDEDKTTKWYVRILIYSTLGDILRLVTYSVFMSYSGEENFEASHPYAYLVAVVSYFAGCIIWCVIVKNLIQYIGLIGKTDKLHTKKAHAVAKTAFFFINFMAVLYIISIPVYIFAPLRVICPVTDIALNIFKGILICILLVISFGIRKIADFQRFTFVFGYALVTAAVGVVYSKTGMHLDFQVNIIFLLLLYITVQIEHINMSNIESVRASLNAAEELNAELEEQYSLQTKAYEKLENETATLNSIADVFIVFFEINLEKKTYRQCGSIPVELAKKLEQMNSVAALRDINIQDLMYGGVQVIFRKEFVEAGKKFVDISTLNERMQGQKSIHIDAINHKDQWHRYMFVRPDDNLNSPLSRVFLLALDINAEIRKIEHLNKVSYIDELTGVLNRNAYVEKLVDIDRSGLTDDLWVMTVDLNGLKRANDTLGHEAGDELIIATAHCLDETVADYGNVYRVGGDEFTVILNASRETVEDLLSQLHEKSKAWKGKHADSLSFSVGYATPKELAEGDYSINNLTKLSDKRMYEDKERYYAENAGLERRGR